MSDPVTIPPWQPPVTPANGLAGQDSLRKITATTAAISTVLPIAYGEVQIGGRIFAATYVNSTWYIGAAFCLGEIDSFQNLYLNDVSVYPTPPTGVSVAYYMGTTAQTANATLAGVLSGYADTLVFNTPRGSVGVAYVVITYSDSAYSGFPKIVARIRGRKVFSRAGNLNTNSEDITAAGYSDSATTRTANVIASPDGATTADKINETATTSTHFINAPQITGLPDYDVCTFSVFVKAAERTFVRVSLLTKNGGTTTITVNLSTGAIVGRAGTYYVGGGAIDHGNGWYRVWVTSNIDTGATVPRGRIVLMTDSTTTSYLGVLATGVYVWGAQFERKASPGIYAATTASASVATYTTNPALMLRDLITDRIAGVGDDIDDVSVQAVYNECEALVISQKRRQAGLVISNARTAEEWISTLSTYAGCWAFSRGSKWVLASDRPPLLWQFTSSTSGFTATNATLTTGATTLTVTQTAADAFITSPSGLNICGGSVRYVRARLRRVSGTATVDGSLSWTTSWHGQSANFTANSTWTATNGTWATLQWDMHQPSTGGVDWRESIITQIRIDLSQSAGTDVWEIDWISVGILPVSNTQIVRDSVRVSIADPSQIPSIVNVRYTDTTPTVLWQERQVQSALAGVTAGTVIPRESTVSLPGVTNYAQAKREATERLNKLQRTAQIDLSTFDEGIAYEVGDVVSLIHAYAGTSANAENDAATLYRVISGPRISTPGKVDFRLAPYADSDYDNTEPTTTWNVNTYALGGINAPRSGDGINRIPPRFAGGFGAVDYDGVLPVRKGANITYASVVIGGVAPDPLVGVYGTYALKVTTDTSSTDRVVWFGSTSADYQMPIDPYSRWLFSAKYWPRAANTSVTFTLKTASTTRTLTDTTNTAQAWNDFVHTADQQNVFDLSADANGLGLLGLDVTAANTTVWFDGLMLEKQISNGAIVSAWRPPIASAVNPARISPRTVAPGTLDDTVAIDDGAGNARTIIAGATSGTVTDGQVVTFVPAYGRVPSVTFSPSALTYTNAAGFGSTNPQTLVCEARSLSTTGFTAYIKVRTTAATITARTDTTPTDAGAIQVPRYLIQKAASASEAWDDRYTFTITCVVKNSRVGEPGAPDFEPGQMVAACYIATADSGSPNFTPTWTKVGTITAGGIGGTSGTTTRTGLTLTVVRDGLTQRGGTTAEFGVAIESELVAGGTLTFTSVKYETATTAPTETSGTAAGVSPVPYMVIPV